MNDNQLLRYSRHILLDDIGMGSPVALYLGSAGIGQITIVDNDVVDITNLQRQIAHNMAKAGMNKAQSARESIASINPEVKVNCIAERADSALLDKLVAQADVVLDCCDNFTTRHAVNAACVKYKKPLVSGAAIRFDGQISVFDPRSSISPCYACVFPPESTFEETRCATMGVFAPLVGIIGSMQAAEALKLLTGVGSSLAGRLLMLDGRAMECNEIRLQRHKTCSVCG
jgi:molybdopterin-synthase adenylyltransferase